MTTEAATGLTQFNRLEPLVVAEAMGLVMAVLEGHRYAADPGDLVGGALAKIVRSLPERVAGPVRVVRETSAAPPPTPETQVSPELTSRLIEACAAARPLRLVYRLGPDHEREMEIEPWAVVLRHSRWYLLGWSRTRQAQRALRVIVAGASEFAAVFRHAMSNHQESHDAKDCDFDALSPSPGTRERVGPGFFTWRRSLRQSSSAGPAGRLPWPSG